MKMTTCQPITSGIAGYGFRPMTLAQAGRHLLRLVQGNPGPQDHVRVAELCQSQASIEDVEQAAKRVQECEHDVADAINSIRRLMNGGLPLSSTQALEIDSDNAANAFFKAKKSLLVNALQAVVATSIPTSMPADWIVMHASRRLVGDKCDYFDGRNYAAINPSLESAMNLIHSNVNQDARVVFVANPAMQEAMALQTIHAEHRESYRQMKLPGRAEAIAGFVLRLRLGHTYGELEELARAAALAMPDVAKLGGTATVQLLLTVEFDLNGELPSNLATGMEANFRDAIGRGALSGSTAAEVVTHDMLVVVLHASEGLQASMTGAVATNAPGTAYTATEEDVLNVLTSNALTPASAVQLPLESMAKRLFLTLDFSLIEQAALYGDDLHEQTDYANDEIARQLREMGILEPAKLAGSPKACKVCNSGFDRAGYCADQTCTHSDWPQSVDCERLTEMTTEQAEKHFGVMKRQPLNEDQSH
jgi:hypothetical protein